MNGLDGGVSALNLDACSALLIKQLFCFFLAEALARNVTMPIFGIVAVRSASLSGGSLGQGLDLGLGLNLGFSLRVSGVPGGAPLASPPLASAAPG